MKYQSAQHDSLVETLSKYLDNIAPIASIFQSTFNKKKHSAKVLTSQQVIQKKKKD